MGDLDYWTTSYILACIAFMFGWIEYYYDNRGWYPKEIYWFILHSIGFLLLLLLARTKKDYYFLLTLYPLLVVIEDAAFWFFTMQRFYLQFWYPILIASSGCAALFLRREMEVINYERLVAGRNKP